MQTHVAAALTVALYGHQASGHVNSPSFIGLLLCFWVSSRLLGWLAWSHDSGLHRAPSSQASHTFSASAKSCSSPTASPPRPPRPLPRQSLCLSQGNCVQATPDPNLFQMPCPRQVAEFPAGPDLFHSWC